MDVQQQIENLSHQLEILKTRVLEQQQPLRLLYHSERENQIPNHQDSPIQTHEKWQPMMDASYYKGSPKMSLTELQSIKDDESDDLEILLMKVEEVCGDVDDNMDGFLNVINDIVVDSQDTARNESAVNTKPSHLHRSVNTLPPIIPRTKEHKIMNHSPNRPFVERSSDARFEQTNSRTQLQNIQPMVKQEQPLRKYHLPKLQYQSQIESCIDVLKTNKTDASLIARKYLNSKKGSPQPTTIYDKTIMDMSMASKEYLRRHHLDDNEQTRFLDVERINQLPKLPHH